LGRDEIIALMAIFEVFEKDGWIARKWNSLWGEIPLWTAAAAITVWWIYDPPATGKAIGALAVVAGIMSVRDIKVLGKISWVILLTSL